MKFERLVLGIISGFVVTGLGILTFENIGRTFFDEYENAPYDPEFLDQFVMSLPTGAFCALLVSHVLGVFLGVFTASYIAKMRRYIPAVFIGAVLFSFSVINAIEIEHPLWYSILDVTLVIPTALLAHKFYLTIVTDPLNT